MTAETFRKTLEDLGTCWERKLVTSHGEIVAKLAAEAR
jgi:hypothetical protein